MTRLIDKIKPEVLKALDRHASQQYPSSHRMIIATLSGIERYRDLTIDQIQTVLTFLPNELHPDGRTDFYYGDYLLQKKYQV